jgi:cell division protein FtsW
MLFIAGLPFRYLAIMAATSVAGMVAAVLAAPYRMARLLSFLDPWAEVRGGGFQIIQSYLAFKNGGLLGTGLGESRQKLFFLPEAHTDFILSVIGEELGLTGVLIAIGLFFWFTRRGFEIGRQAIALERSFAGLVAQGIAIWIGAQGFFNMGVNLGLLPTKGLTLPFMSYGGSGILVNMIAMAVLLRVDHENRRLMRGART